MLFVPSLTQTHDVTNKETQTQTTKEQKTGMESKYIGQVVKVISPVTKTSGAITIYGERWEARTDGDSEIAEGANVKIIRNESLIMFVEEVK